MVAIIIPTKDRSVFLIRQLCYYASVNCPYTIYIGDASKAEHSNSIQIAVNKLKGKIKIVYVHYPVRDDNEFNSLQNRDNNVVFCIKELMGMVGEKYVAYVGDDDFLVPNSLGKCAEFLEVHPEYRSVQGKGVQFVYVKGKSDGTLHLTSGSYRGLKDAESECAGERLRQFLGDYWVPMFSLHRTQEFYEDYKNADLLLNVVFTEIMPNCLTIIRGKSKSINCFYLVRQSGHAERWIWANNHLDWISKPSWQPSYEIFYNEITQALAVEMGVSEEEASVVAKKAFGKYLVKSALKEKILENNSCLSRAKGMAKRMPGTRKFYDIIRSRVPYFREEMKLQTLLLSSSPYNQEFMPLFKLIKDPFNSKMIF